MSTSMLHWRQFVIGFMRLSATNISVAGSDKLSKVCLRSLTWHYYTLYIVNAACLSLRCSVGKFYWLTDSIGIIFHLISGSRWRYIQWIMEMLLTVPYVWRTCLQILITNFILQYYKFYSNFIFDLWDMYTISFNRTLNSMRLRYEWNI